VVDRRTEGVVDTKVKTTVNNNTNDRGDKSTIKTSDTIRGEGLLVDIDQAIELTLSSTLGGLSIVGETGTGVIERVDKEEGRGTSSSSGCNVTSEPLPVSVLLPKAEEGLEVVL
jgi:hypothetical protein